MTAYEVGKRFEHKVRNALRTDGYEVTRAAGSKTKLDLIAMKPGQLLFVQCKITGTIAALEWDRLVELAGWVGALPILAVNAPRGRGVALWRLTGPRVRGRPLAAQPAVRFWTDELAEPGFQQDWLEAGREPESTKIPELTPSPPFPATEAPSIALRGMREPGKRPSSADAGPPITTEA